MNRRDFLKAISAGVIGVGIAPDVFAEISRKLSSERISNLDDHIKDYLHKMRDFSKPHRNDVYLPRDQLPLLKSTVKRLRRLQRTVGHGNFHLLSFDGAIRYSSAYSRVGAFTRQELEFLERMFYEDCTSYGFFGQKPVTVLTDAVPKREVTKIRGSGNYLYRGEPARTYEKIHKELGRQVILTSGIRSVIKQFLLYLNKAYTNAGNLSLASRSLAPPGYSYHGVGDFDVGQVGFGIANFTERFATTPVYRHLMDLGYIQIRYERGNMLGVRFEPWHVKVI